MGSDLANAGIVQIRRHGQWVSFCTLRGTPASSVSRSHVVCRELGYRRAISPTEGHRNTYSTEMQPDALIWNGVPMCIGNESSIYDCDLTSWYFFGCDNSKFAGVICEPNKEPGLDGKLAVDCLLTFSLLWKESKPLNLWSHSCRLRTSRVSFPLERAYSGSR